MLDPGPMDVIAKLHEVDPVFREVCDLLFGDAVDVREAYDISKMNDQSEVHTTGNLKIKKPNDRNQRKVTAALSATGAAAGVAGLAYAGKDAVKAYKTPGMKIKASTKALIPLEVAGLGGELMATKILHNDTKKKQETEMVSKAFTDAVGEIVQARREGKIDTATAMSMAMRLADEVEGSVAKAKMPGFLKGIPSYLNPRAYGRMINANMARPPAARAARLTNQLAGLNPAVKVQRAVDHGNQLVADAPKAKRMVIATAAAAGAGGGAAGGAAYSARKAKKRAELEPVGKADYGFVGEISKMDTDKRLAFGWCSLSTVDGEPVVDLQGDYAPIEEIEKSAYAYVQDSRVGGDMHAREGEGPRHTSDLVESFIATPEKLQEMGLSEEVAKSVPVGWWVGFKINDDEQWAMVKDGRRAGFSIHGIGKRVSKSIGHG